MNRYFFTMWFKLCLCFFLLYGLTAADNGDSCQDLDPADDPKNIERPCPDFDVNCIRAYFAANSQCHIAQGPVPDPLFLEHYMVNLAISNVSVELNNVEIGDLNGKIVEFYINSETDKLVLALEVQSLRLNSSKAVAKYARKSKEPIVRSDCAEIDFGTVLFTAVFSDICNLDLRNVDVFSFNFNAVPKILMGAELVSVSDPDALKEIEVFGSKLGVNLQEGFASSGAILMANYIQYNICDFGLDLSYENSFLYRFNKKE